MAEPRFSDKCKVNISQDNMRASLFLEPPADGLAYSVEELTSFLKLKGVYTGIIFSELENMTQNNIYGVDHEVAKGTLPTEGTSGYYEIFFDSESKKKPLIRSDGSVDYQSMSAIDNVRKGEKLAEYHPAVQGTHGYDVRGRQLRCEPCKDLPAFKGSGFDYDEETHIYTAAIDGRIEYKQSNNTLFIRDVYDHKGDVDYVVGKIDFRGDVVIHGNVLSGTYIRASKTITIEGSVEAATLIAEGDIILKKGIAGDKKAKISCGGNVYASFIEFTTVEAKGNVEANIIMNSTISVGKDIIISGKRGAIVGGVSYAVGFINSTFLGNIAGHKSLAAVGATKELQDRNHLLNVKLERAKKGLKSTNEEIQKVKDSRIVNERKEVKEAKLSQLNRRKIRDERIIGHIYEELDRIKETMSIASVAKITVNNTAYAGTVIHVDEKEMELTTDMKKVEFVKDRETGEIRVDGVQL